MDFYLSSKSLARIKEAGIENDFKLIIFDDIVECSKFVAAFLSPQISHLINNNVSVDQFYVRFPDKLEFYSSNDELKKKIKQLNFIKQFQDFLEGQSFHINQIITSEISIKPGSFVNQNGNKDIETAKLLIIFGKALGNDEMIDGGLKFLGINEDSIEITPNNIFDLIQFSRIREYHKNNQKLYEYIASNFISLFNKDNIENRKKLLELRNSEFESILKSPKLYIEDEDSLFELILSLGTNFYNLFDYIEVKYLSTKSIEKLIELINNDEVTLHPLLWSSICRRLTIDFSQNSQFLNPRQKQTLVSCENGIINYLNKSTNSNLYLAKEIEIESSKKDCGKIDSLFDNSQDTHFRLANRKDSFILFDFKNKKIMFSKYYFSVPSSRNTAYTGRPKSWKIEGSNDKNNWDLIDFRQNDTFLNNWNCSHTYNCQYNTNKLYRYVRIKDIVSHNDTQEFLLSEIEFYGTLVKH